MKEILLEDSKPSMATRAISTNKLSELLFKEDKLINFRKYFYP